MQNDFTNRLKLWRVCQTLNFTFYFTIKMSIFKLWPLFRVVRLINSFYRRYVFCMCNISNISRISPTYPIYFIYSIHSIHSVIRSYIWGLFLSWFPCRNCSSYRISRIVCHVVEIMKNIRTNSASVTCATVDPWCSLRSTGFELPPGTPRLLTTLQQHQSLSEPALDASRWSINRNIQLN